MEEWTEAGGKDSALPQAAFAHFVNPLSPQLVLALTDPPLQLACRNSSTVLHWLVLLPLCFGGFLRVSSWLETPTAHLIVQILLCFVLFGGSAGGALAGGGSISRSSESESLGVVGAFLKEPAAGLWRALWAPAFES